MNGYERISAALTGKPSDKVPIMLHNFMMAAEEHGITMSQYREDPSLSAGCVIAAVEKYGYDGILVDFDTVTLAGALGVPIDFPEHEPARIKGTLLQDYSDLAYLPGVNIENYRYVNIWLEAVRKLSEYFGNEIFIRGNCDQCAFSLASMVRGLSEWMMDFYLQDETKISALLEYCSQATEQFLKLMSQTGCHMLSNGDSPAGPELLPPEQYMKYALPFEVKAVEASHSFGLPYALHICGDTGLILEDMISSGADALELDYKTDICLIRERVNGRVTFIGNIDPSGVLAMGTPELVRSKIGELLEIYGNSNRFILNAGCAIPANAPSENIEAMIASARSFR
jgi:MtaA/CmuA family methyltransferase